MKTFSNRFAGANSLEGVRPSHLTYRGIGLAMGLTVSLAGSARAEDAPRRVHGSATVEVIDDARHVDDIISRQRQRNAAPPSETAPGAKASIDRLSHPEPARDPAGTPAAQTPRGDEHKIDRPSLPPASHEEQGGRGESREKGASRTERRTDRERHPTTPAARHHR